jgi:predicted acyl esterase
MAPKKITENPDMAIVMSDGTRLSARVWMPKYAPTVPVPAILEFLPYRKRDGEVVLLFQPVSSQFKMDQDFT